MIPTAPTPPCHSQLSFILPDPSWVSSDLQAEPAATGGQLREQRADLQLHGSQGASPPTPCAEQLLQLHSQQLSRELLQRPPNSQTRCCASIFASQAHYCFSYGNLDDEGLLLNQLLYSTGKPQATLNNSNCTSSVFLPVSVYFSLKRKVFPSKALSSLQCSQELFVTTVPS